MSTVGHQEIAERRCLVVPAAGVRGILGALPALEALAASGRRLVVLAAPRPAALLRLVPVDVESVIAMPRRRQTLAAIRAAGCDEAVLLDDTFAAARLAWAAGIPRRWGYRRGPRSLLLRPAVPRPRKAGDGLGELLRAAGAEAPTLEGAQLAFPEVERERARERLARARLEPDGHPRLGVYAGVQGGASDKPWRRQRFEELLRELRRRRPRRRFVLLATTEDLWTAVQIHEATARLHPVVGPDLDLAVLAAVMAELDLVIAADSWMLSLARAAGTTTMGLHIARSSPDDHPDHASIHAASLAEIEPEQVLDAIEGIDPDPDAL